jgi:hypothetical protein
MNKQLADSIRDTRSSPFGGVSYVAYRAYRWHSWQREQAAGTFSIRSVPSDPHCLHCWVPRYNRDLGRRPICGTACLGAL